MQARPQVDTLRIIESFRTIQGEGPFLGHPATFLRLAGCNLTCSWCDTPYSWDWSRFDRAAESRQVTLTEAAALVAGAALVVVTGGEPLLQRNGLAGVPWPESVTLVQFETNGTRAPGLLAADDRSYFVVSPKLGNGGDPEAQRVKPEVLAEFAALAHRGRACLKIVVTSPADVAEAAALAEAWGFPRGSSWVLPEGITRDEHLSTLTRVADAAVAHGMRLSTRLHLLAWPGVLRGR